jgi:tetratricopeptide (TPR) repeat protein
MTMGRTDLPLTPSATEREELLRRWIDAALDAALDTALRAVVSEPGPWQSTYRSLVQRATRTLGIIAWPVGAALDVATSAGGVSDIRPAYTLGLPHLDPTKRLTLWNGFVGDLVGAWWQDPSGTRFVPSTSATHRWGDAVLGDVTTELRWAMPSTVDVAWRMLCDLQRLALGEAHPNGLRLAHASIDALTHGFLRDALARCAMAYRHAEEVDGEELLVMRAVALSRTLDQASAMLLDDGVFARLAEIEEALAPHADAVEMLSDRAYREVVDGDPPAPGSWWGHRWFEEQAARSKSPVVPPAPRAGVTRVAYASSHPRPASAVGSVPVLLGLGGRGLVARLRVFRADAGTTGMRQVELRPLAWQAVRTGFQAAAARMPHGLPRFPLDEHGIEVELPAGEAEHARFLIDGDSLALSAALAFASLWTERTVPSDLAASASLRVAGDVTTGPVGDVRVKAEAWAAWGGDQPMRLALHPDVAGDAEGTGVTAVPVDTLDQALATAELFAVAASFTPWMGDVASRRAHLRTLCEDVETQRLDPYALPGFEPWTVIADRIRVLVRSLELVPATGEARELQLRARAFGALAFLHAGDDEGAGTILPDEVVRSLLEAHRGSTVPKGAHALLLLVALGRLVGRHDDAARREADGLSSTLDGLLADVGDDDRATFEGRVLGTQGRLWLHRHHPALALSLFERSLRAHDRPGLQHEVGRSRVSLARSLRMLGRHDEALAAFAQAEHDLDAHARPWSVAYHASCWMFLRYERARLLVDMGRAVEAEAEARRSLEATEVRGFWPRAGVLRVLAWALRLQGRDGEADDRAAEIEALAARAPSSAGSLIAAFADEARRLPRADDDPY